MEINRDPLDLIRQVYERYSHLDEILSETPTTVAKTGMQ